MIHHGYIMVNSGGREWVKLWGSNPHGLGYGGPYNCGSISTYNLNCTPQVLDLLSSFGIYWNISV